MPENEEIVVYFTNGRMVRIPLGKYRFAHLGSNTDEEYTPDISGDTAVVNWDNVCFVRKWFPPEDIDP